MSRSEELLALLPAGFPANQSSAEAACLVAERIAALPRDEGPPVIGINGAQGSGKSTLTQLIGLALEQFHGMRPALLSLDDFYLGKPPRLQLARLVHPMCETRGVPGTHDTQLMADTLDALTRAEADSRIPLPRFDKLDDDRVSREAWPEFEGRPDAILLEGWCVGLRAADVPEWSCPINELEAAEDPQGEWVRWSMKELARDYPAIWDRFALLVSIEVPDIETVIASRLKQEDGLAAGSDRPRMDRDGVTRFVQHYERFTRAIWASMPQRADMLFRRTPDFGYSLVK